MELTYAQLEMTLTTHFRVHPDKVGTFRSRVKQLQRLQFPSGVNVGRGAKMVYSLEHLMQMVSAFELINLGMPAATATTLVATFWRNFAAGYSLAFQYRSQYRFGDNIYIRIMNRNLAEIQGELLADPVTVIVEDTESLNDILSRNTRRSVYTYAIICVTDVCYGIIDILERVAQVAAPWQQNETQSWAVLPAEEDWWMRAGGGWKMPWLSPAEPEGS